MSDHRSVTSAPPLRRLTNCRKKAHGDTEIGCFCIWGLKPGSCWCFTYDSRWWFHFSLIFTYVYPTYLKWSSTTNMFQPGWNHQLVFNVDAWESANWLWLHLCLWTAINEAKCNLMLGFKRTLHILQWTWQICWYRWCCWHVDSASSNTCAA